jgi:hypothetical protein
MFKPERYLITAKKDPGILKGKAAGAEDQIL